MKAIVDLSQMSSRLKKSFENVINEAVEQEIILPELSKELHYLRKNIRNILTHRLAEKRLMV